MIPIGFPKGFRFPLTPPPASCSSLYLKNHSFREKKMFHPETSGNTADGRHPARLPVKRFFLFFFVVVAVVVLCLFFCGNNTSKKRKKKGKWSRPSPIKVRSRRGRCFRPLPTRVAVSIRQQMVSVRLGVLFFSFLFLKRNGVGGQTTSC